MSRFAVVLALALVACRQASSVTLSGDASGEPAHRLAANAPAVYAIVVDGTANVPVLRLLQHVVDSRLGYPSSAGLTCTGMNCPDAASIPNKHEFRVVAHPTIANRFAVVFSSRTVPGGGTVLTHVVAALTRARNDVDAGTATAAEQAFAALPDPAPLDATWDQAPGAAQSDVPPGDE